MSMTEKQMQDRIAELEQENKSLKTVGEPEGLYEKYRVVHKGTREVVMRPFVLVPEKDELAIDAILSYAKAIKKTQPILSKELSVWMQELLNPPQPEEVEDQAGEE